MTPEELLTNAAEKFNRGDYNAALTLAEECIEKLPDNADAWHVLGLSQEKLDRLVAASASLSRAVKLSSTIEMRQNLARVLGKSGQVDAALALYRALEHQDPQSVSYPLQTARLLVSQRRYRESLAAFDRVLTLQPDNTTAWISLGHAHLQLSQLNDAITAYTRALALKADHVPALINIGICHLRLSQDDLAEEHLNRALTLDPTQFQAWNALGALHLKRNGYAAAGDCFRRALEQEPGNSNAAGNLAAVLVNQLEHQEAVETLEGAVPKAPLFGSAWDNYLFTTLYNNLDPARSARNHFEWGHLVKRVLPEKDRSAQPAALRIPPKTEIVVGLVSADFCTHPVSWFLISVLRNHNPARIRYIAYDNGAHQDDVTDRLRRHMDGWRNIANQPTDDVRRAILRDEVDVLMDLSGHTQGNRLDVFAQRAAPVQVAWLGYPATTGLDTMDFRLTDSIADPPGMSESWHSEQLIRLPDCFLCYTPPRIPAAAQEQFEQQHPESGPGITFGSFNNLAKLTLPTLELWASIVRAVPGSRLMLKSAPLEDEATRQRIEDLFRQAGLDQEQLVLVPRTHSIEEHLQLLSRIDIALDTFPYNGTTTTFEALWMGVPVITLAGEAHVSRVSASILTHLGLSAYVAKDPDHYRQLAVSLARDTRGRQKLTSELRTRMNQSVLTDSVRFREQFESTLRELVSRSQ